MAYPTQFNPDPSKMKKTERNRKSTPATPERPKTKKRSQILWIAAAFPAHRVPLRHHG
jgi:hypothetical protein